MDNDKLIFCTCDENPLCTKCEGRGYYHSYEDPLIHSTGVTNRGTSESNRKPLYIPSKVVRTILTRVAKPQPDKCPFCFSKVSKNKLQKHINNRCKLVPQKLKSPKGKKGKQQKKKGGLNIETFNSSSQYNTERRLDGSFGFHVARENGRFGSHSSYDNLEDEAHP